MPVTLCAVTDVNCYLSVSSFVSFKRSIFITLNFKVISIAIIFLNISFDLYDKFIIIYYVGMCLSCYDEIYGIYYTNIMHLTLL